MLIHSSFEIARGPMDIKQQQGMPSSTDVVGRGYLHFRDLSMGPLTSSFFFGIMDGGASPGCVFLRLRCFFLDKSLYGQEMQNLNLNPSLAFGRSEFLATKLLNALGMYKLGKHFGGQKQDALITLKTNT